MRILMINWSISSGVRSIKRSLSLKMASNRDSTASVMVMNSSFFREF